jgi:hypothetical protein
MFMKGGLIVLRIGSVQVAGSCEHGNEPSGSIKFVEFLAYQMSCCFSRTLFHAVN